VTTTDADRECEFCGSTHPPDAPCRCCVCGREVELIEDDQTCGSMRCGLAVQYAADYHAERGG
jgi:hypothetical protein